MTKALTKNALNSVETNLASTDISTMESVINKTRNDVLSSFNMTNNFFIDQESKTKIDELAQNMGNKKTSLDIRVSDIINKEGNLTAERAPLITKEGTLNTILTGVLNAAQRTQYSTELANVKGRIDSINIELTNLTAEKAKLNTIITNINSTRITEYQTLSHETDKFDYTRSLQDMDKNTYNLDLDLMVPGRPAPTTHGFFDEKGNRLTMPFLTTITLQDGTTKEVQVQNIVFNPPASGILDVSRITLLDRAGVAFVPTQGYQLTIHPGAEIIIPGIPPINTIHSKPLKIIRPNPNIIKKAKRIDSYDDLNAGNTINTKIDILHASHHTSREDDVVREMLSATGNKDEVDAVKNDPVKSKAFIQRFRAIGGVAFPLINTAAAHAGFKTAMVDIKRKIPDEYLVSEEKFKDYLRNNLDKNIEEYMRKDIRDTLDTAPNRDLVLREFISFKNPLSQAQRSHAYDDVNTGNTINDRINIEHTNNNTEKEEDVIREILSESGSKEEMEAIRKNDAQAKELIKKIRSLITIPVVDIATTQTGFKTAMIDPTRSIPEEYLVNEETFKNYLGKDLDKNIVDHLRKTIKKNLDTPANRGEIIRELLNFQTELKNNKIDSDVNQRADTDLNGIEMESKKRLGLFGRKDKNYMSFFSGSSIDIPEQTVNLNKEVKYSMNLKVSGKNEIRATIKIGDKEIIKKGGDPMKLMHDILKEKSIPEGKTRLHIAYNIISGMIQMAKKEDISLSFYDRSSNTNRIIKHDGKNIVLENQDDNDPYNRKTTTLFDYGLFESTNSWENPNRSGRGVLAPDNRTIRTGLEQLTKHFNYAMTETYKYYGEATQRRGLGLLRSNTSSDFPTSAWTSPIKKLLNSKTTTNFDFSTSVDHNGKSVQIERKGNVFILNIDGVEIKGKDFGKLLKKRKGGIRLFDGVERAICGEIYKNMVEKLRTNTKIARSSFGVVDEKTGRMYILDEDGEIGYLRAEEAGVERKNLKRRPGANTAANIAIAGGLGAAGIATGGAAALAAGLSWGAAETAASWGAMTAPGISVFKDIRRIAGRGYGTLDHVPAARTMCNESETREIYKDPFLMGKLMKVMNLRLGQL